MAQDFVHTAQIVDGVIAALRAQLPANWFTDDGTETPLQLLEHGDLADYPTAGAVTDDCPALLVRGLGPQPGGRGGVGGVQETQETIRVIHIRTPAQCWDDDGARETNAARARARYAKLINQALFADPVGRMAAVHAATGARTEISLTCEDGAGAQIVMVQWQGWDLGHDLPGTGALEDVQRFRRLPTDTWAIGCELQVTVRSGGSA